MPIESFNITNTKILRKAYCDKVPKFMVIAGPNGIGKSTLLYECRKFSGERVRGSGKILYTAPHRTWRKRSIKSSWLWQQARADFYGILGSDSIPSLEGMHLQDAQRRPDSADEAPGFVKYILGQLETRRQAAIVSMIDKNNLKYPDGYAPDFYRPLRDMLEVLLPHLQFIGIDQKNRDNMQCLLKTKGVDTPIDIDDLSSGEKEIIALFVPLIEREIVTLLRKVERGEMPDLDTTPDTIMLIDEPDLHIHSVLQKRMIEYIRKRAYEGNVQFIITTHSPVIINEATSEELFVLVEKDRTQDNQLFRVVSSPEKLDLLKSVCGDVAILTLGRPIVFIEGKKPAELRNAPSDQRILELLWEGAKDFSFVPMGGKDEIEKSTLLLNQIITEKLVGFPVYAVVDADLNSLPSSPSILKWKFCTIENALLDSSSIFEVLEPYKEKAGFSSVEDVERELLDICSDILQDEINRRLRGIAPSFHLDFEGKTIEELVQERDAGLGKLSNYFTKPDEVERIKNKVQSIPEEVDKMIQDKTALLRFNGKTILGKLYQRKVAGKGIGMSFGVFCYSVAEKIGKGNRTPESIKETLLSIKENLERSMTNQSV